MERQPPLDRPMSAAERKRKQRQAEATAEVRAGRIRRAWDAAGGDAQRLFVGWLRRMKIID